MVNWIDILRVEVAKSNITQVAAKLGYARPSISLALSGNYKGSTDKLATAVLNTFDAGIFCPHLQQPIGDDDCAEFQSRPIPQSNASALRHWRACQNCELAVSRLEGAS